MREKLFIDLTGQENAVLSPDGVILEVGNLAWNYSFRRYIVSVSVLRFFIFVPTFLLLGRMHRIEVLLLHQSLYLSRSASRFD